MLTTYFLNRWEEVKSSASTSDLRELANQIAQTFLDRFFFNDCYEDDLVALLCEMSIHFKDEELNKVGASVLFGGIVEILCDEFEELQTKTYNRFMSHVIAICKDHSEGSSLLEKMESFNINSSHDLYDRAERLRKSSSHIRDFSNTVKKIIILSRVTIGADIAVTSVLAQRFSKLYPQAEVILLGNSKIKGLFSANPGIRILETGYVRRDGLMSRLKSWLDVLETIESEIKDISHSEVLVIDPDSRLSQLGLLPLIEDDSYLFFNSRKTLDLDPLMSISQMANQWVSQLSGTDDFSYPALWLAEDQLAISSSFVNNFKNAGCSKFIFINLGVGGNSRKRVSDEFEKTLLLQLLKEPDTVVCLDQGFGDEELKRSFALSVFIEKSGFPVSKVSFSKIFDISFKNGLICMDAGISEATSMIASSDEFIGYDSACQHIAAALEIPAYTIFAGSNNTRFIRRWRPFGSGRNEIIHVDTLSHPIAYDIDTIIMRIMHAREQK